MRYFLFLFLISAHAFSTDFVYRVDTRPPDVIFAQGFNSWGDNLNLQQHLRGHSCTPSGESAFISTTTSLSETNSIARQYFSSRSGSGRRYYRYRIRADINFYNVAPSVRYLEDNGVVFTEIEHLMLSAQQEVMAITRIRPSNIIEAVELNYNRFDSSVSDGAGSSNSSYEALETSINGGIVPALPLPETSLPQRINAFGFLIASCLSLNGAKNSKSKTYGDVYFYDANEMVYQLSIPVKM